METTEDRYVLTEREDGTLPSFHTHPGRTDDSEFDGILTHRKREHKNEGESLCRDDLEIPFDYNVNDDKGALTSRAQRNAEAPPDADQELVYESPDNFEQIETAERFRVEGEKAYFEDGDLKAVLTLYAESGDETQTYRFEATLEPDSDEFNFLEQLSENVNPAEVDFETATASYATPEAALDALDYENTDLLFEVEAGERTIKAGYIGGAPTAHIDSDDEGSSGGNHPPNEPPIEEGDVTFVLDEPWRTLFTDPVESLLFPDF